MWNLGLDEAKYCRVQAQFINTMQADVKELVWYEGVVTTKCLREVLLSLSEEKPKAVQNIWTHA